MWVSLHLAGWNATHTCDTPRSRPFVTNL
jgi:hypothetical protein